MHKHIWVNLFFPFCYNATFSQEMPPPVPDVYAYSTWKKTYNIRDVKALVMDGGFGYNMFMVRSPQVYETDMGGMSFLLV